VLAEGDRLILQGGLGRLLLCAASVVEEIALGAAPQSPWHRLEAASDVLVLDLVVMDVLVRAKYIDGDSGHERDGDVGELLPLVHFSHRLLGRVAAHHAYARAEGPLCARQES